MDRNKQAKEAWLRQIRAAIEQLIDAMPSDETIQNAYRQFQDSAGRCVLEGGTRLMLDRLWEQADELRKSREFYDHVLAGLRRLETRALAALSGDES